MAGWSLESELSSMDRLAISSPAANARWSTPSIRRLPELWRDPGEVSSVGAVPWGLVLPEEGLGGNPEHMRLKVDRAAAQG